MTNQQKSTPERNHLKDIYIYIFSQAKVPFVQVEHKENALQPAKYRTLIICGSNFLFMLLCLVVIYVNDSDTLLFSPEFVFLLFPCPQDSLLHPHLTLYVWSIFPTTEGKIYQTKTSFLKLLTSLDFSHLLK